MATRVDAYVGEQIRLRRIASRMSITELAQTIGVSFQQLQKYETGRNRVSASMLYAIASRLDVPPSEFFSGLPQREDGALSIKSDKRIAYLATAEGGQLVDELLVLPKRVRGRVVSLVSVLVDELTETISSDDVEDS